jgi:hypothetical protein
MVQSMISSSSMLLLCLACLAASSMAFTPSAAVTSRSRGVAFQPATFVKGATPMARQQAAAAAATLRILRMAEQETSEGTKSKVGADGTFYDDEVRKKRAGDICFLWCHSSCIVVVVPGLTRMLVYFEENWNAREFSRVTATVVW